jgi:hypothetical protein
VLSSARGRKRSGFTSLGGFSGIQKVGYHTAPCRDGEVPPKPSPSVSIDLTAISNNLAASDDEEGVVLPWG